MVTPPASRLPDLLAQFQKSILADWLETLRATSVARLPAAELEAQCDIIIARLAQSCRDDNVTNIAAPAFGPLRDVLAELSRTRALQGFSPRETATFMFSLKQPLFARLRSALAAEPAALASETLAAGELIDQLGLFMMETFQQAREEVIIRQQTEISELSTPVVRLWQGILALPLIGTLDSARTQVVMENLLDSIVRYEADIAIIDITGVPTVDTLVAQHLLKTVAAARLMGADCIISGIRPQIAQTMVHLGVELNVISKANLSDAFAVALRRLGKTVVNQKPSAPANAE
ncbi:MAG: STAS domain-containing protein [Rhodopila sp.]|jgi:rsbT co-antagonist protein RsbR